MGKNQSVKVLEENMGSLENVSVEIFKLLLKIHMQ